MKRINEIVSIVLIITILFCLTGCSMNKLSHVKIAEYLDKEARYYQYNDIDEFAKIFGTPVKGNEGFISFKDEKAQELYDRVFNNLFSYSDFNIVEATCSYGGNSSGANALFLFTLNDEKEAEKFFKDVKTAFEDNGDTDNGDENGITYFCSCKTTNKRHVIRNVYLEKNTVLIVMCAANEIYFVDDFFKYFKLPYIIDGIDD